MLCKITADWVYLGGHSVDAVTTEFVDASECPVETLQLPNRAVIACLEPPSDQSTDVYLRFCVPPRLRLRLIRIICTARKMELFTSSLAEYQNVVLGESLNEEDDDIGVSLCVFEVSLENRRVQQAALKFFPLLDQCQKTFDIYEVELHLSTNAGPAMTGPTSTINIQNVQAMLDASVRPLSAPAEKFRQFLAGAQQGAAPPTLAAMMTSIANRSVEEQTTTTLPHGPNNEGAAFPATTATSLSTPSTGSDNLGPVVSVLRQYMDTKLELLETRLISRVTEMEMRLDKKLDSVLSILQKRSSDGDGMELELD